MADRGLVRDLLVERRVMALSVLVDGEPFVGQLPFAVRPDFGALLIHASRLARHSRGLHDGARFSVLIQAPEEGHDDPFQVPRLALKGVVRSVRRDSERYAEAKGAYLHRLPTGLITFSLDDFELFELVVEHARLVAGFGRTLNLTPGSLRELAGGEPHVGENFGGRAMSEMAAGGEA